MAEPFSVTFLGGLGEIGRVAAGVRDPLALEREMRNTTGKVINHSTGRRPMIVPVLMEK